MTRALEIVSQEKLKLYRKTLLKTCSDKDVANYKAHWNMYSSLKSKLKKDFYHSKSTDYKQNARKLWSLINNTIKKVKHKGSIIPYITVNGLKQYNPSKITNCFGEFYSNLGPSLAKQILHGTTPISTYLGNIP